MSGITLVFEVEKETKGTFKFAERVEGALAEPKIGTLYVRKSTLGELDWTPGGTLKVTVEAS